MEKLNCKSLMIGDWVYRPDCYDQVKEFRHTGVIGIDGMRGLITFNELEPIPLTPEILEKNGFIEDGKRHWTLSDEYTGDDVIGLYEVANGFAMLTSGLTIGLQSVHELQHLFRLCGIEKEIIL